MPDDKNPLPDYEKTQVNLPGQAGGTAPVKKDAGPPAAASPSTPKSTRITQAANTGKSDRLQPKAMPPVKKPEADLEDMAFTTPLTPATPAPDASSETRAKPPAPELGKTAIIPAPSQAAEELDETSISIPAVKQAASNGSTGPLRAIISDVHGNYEALVAVLEDIKQQGVHEIVCLGDVVGYGPDPVPCLRTVRRVSHWSLCGNHDAAVFMTHAVGFREAAQKAISLHRAWMRPTFFSLPGTVSRWRWLENLPAQRIEGRVMYVHASPSDPLMDYVLEEDFQDMGFGPSQKVLDRYEKFEWVCFVGHSHRPGVATHEYKWIRPAALDNLTYILPPDQKTLVNIGAVGQPRDNNPDACYVLFDGVSVRYRRVAYDVATTQRKIRSIPELVPALADRLARGL